jgi:hypothetical protein
MQVFQEVLWEYHAICDVTKRYYGVALHCADMVDSIDPQADVDAFSDRHGPGQCMFLSVIYV